VVWNDVLRVSFVVGQDERQYIDEIDEIATRVLLATNLSLRAGVTNHQTTTVRLRAPPL
jgi:hypothetical protein